MVRRRRARGHPLPCLVDRPGDDRSHRRRRARGVALDQGVGFAEGTVYAFTDPTGDRRLEQPEGDFVATVSHELRTPLAAVHGAAKTLQREDVVAGTEVFEHLLALIAEQFDRLAGWSTTSCSQAGSTPRAGAGDRARRRRAARRRRGRGRPGARGRTVATSSLRRRRRRRCCDLRPVAAGLDESRRERGQVLPAGGRIQVDLQVRDGHLDIAVRDQGLGIAIAEQRLIFEKFYRVDANMSRGVSRWCVPAFTSAASCAPDGRDDRGRVSARGGLDVHRVAAAGGCDSRPPPARTVITILPRACPSLK